MCVTCVTCVTHVASQGELGRLELQAVSRELEDARAAYGGLQEESAKRLGAVERCLEVRCNRWDVM